MANEEKLMELLRRAHAVIGEGLIENALDEFAEGLHDEIGEVLGLPAAKRDTVRCTAARGANSGQRAAQYERMLRAKLSAIRDEAMELQAMLEFAHGGDDAADDDVWKFSDRTVRHAEEILTNCRGELSLPESE